MLYRSRHAVSLKTKDPASYCTSHTTLAPLTRMRYSALSGSLGAVAGLLGKLGADGDSNALQLLEVQCAASSLSESCNVLTSVVRLLCLALMLGVNGLMINLFVKGLHETDSLTATVTSSAVSCVLSAAGGYFFFQELLPARWFVGAAVIVVGLAFLLHGDKTEDKTKED